ncbi:MAG: hypothetical protein AAFQ78_01270, partial [Bacteroidota bacterium]
TSDNFGHIVDIKIKLYKFEEVLECYKQALCMALRFYKREHPNISRHYKRLDDCMCRLKESELIQQTKAEVLPLCIQYLGKDHELTKALSVVDSNDKQQTP